MGKRPDMKGGKTYLSPHLKLHDLYLISDDRRLVTFVKGGIEHLDSIGVKLVRKAWPFKGERHVRRRVECSCR